MDNVVEELLNRYEIMVEEKIAMQFEKNRHISKEEALVRQLEELSREVTILKRTIECHDLFICENELKDDYEKFKDKWLEGGSV